MHKAEGPIHDFLIAQGFEYRLQQGAYEFRHPDDNSLELYHPDEMSLMAFICDYIERHNQLIIEDAVENKIWEEVSQATEEANKGREDALAQIAGYKDKAERAHKRADEHWSKTLMCMKILRQRKALPKSTKAR